MAAPPPLTAYHRLGMAIKPLPGYTMPGRLAPRRHFAPYLIARFILIVLAVIGVVAIALLVLGLLNVHAVTDHFRVH
jgi:hypothetical protein